MTLMIRWDDRLSVGEATIDADHRQLVILFEQLCHAVIGGHGDDVIRDTLAALTGYTTEHFAREEALMHEVGYPGSEKHRDEHLQLLVTVQRLADAVESDATAVSGETLEFLGDWLTHHICGSDMSLAEFVRDRTPESAAAE